MKPLRNAVEDYIALRRSLGFKLRDMATGLTEFTAFLEQKEAPYITTALCLLAGYVRKARCAIQRQNQHIRTGLLVDPAAKYLDGTPPRLGNSVLTLIKNILINIVNQSITLSKETDFVFDFLSENIKTTGCADRSAGANCIS
jgi:hypothetical protein